LFFYGIQRTVDYDHAHAKASDVRVRLSLKDVPALDRPGDFVRLLLNQIRKSEVVCISSFLVSLRFTETSIVPGGKTAGASRFVFLFSR